MRDILKLGVILMLYCLAAAASLAYFHNKTAPIIEANKEAKAGDSVRLEVLPGMEGGFEKQGEGTDFVYWTGYTDKGKRSPGGYVFITYGKGYSSTIETLTGVNIEGVITGVKILFQQETPGLGDKVQQIRRGESDPWFPRQFIGKSAFDDIKLAKDNGTIDAITGATISSRALTNSINEGLKKLVEATGGKTFVKDAGAAAPVVQPKEEEPPKLPTDDIIAQVLPVMAGGFDLKGGDTEFPYWIGYIDAGKSKAGGYAFLAKGKGFASTVETLVGIDLSGKITGVKILSQEETEGYGDKIMEVREGEKEPWFTRQFIGRSVNETIALKNDGGVIDGITGATITSKAVTESIDTALRTMMEIITGNSYSRKIKPSNAIEIIPAPIQEEGNLSSNDVIASVLPHMAGGYEVQSSTTDFPYWIGYSEAGKSTKGGYAFITKGNGFSSTIETLVGVDLSGKIIGIKIVSQEETVGYGDKITEVREGEKEPWFMHQFIGKSTADKIALTDDGGVIDGISGATITSKAVTGSIDSCLTMLMDIVSGKSPAPHHQTQQVAKTQSSSLPPNDVVAIVLPDMTGGLALKDEAGDFLYWVGYQDSGKTKAGGYAFIAKGMGFASTIETLVGVDNAGKIIGIKILSQEETEGYGDKITEIRESEKEPWFMHQFIGKSTADKIALTDDGGVIDGISGATITSKAVTESIDSGIKKLLEVIKNSSQ